MKTLISPSLLKAYVDQFNADDEELYVNIPNEEALAFLTENIPLFECPDKDFERTYYFRWWTYRKHVKLTDDGYVITEFLPPVPWAGRHNTVNLTACLHLKEGRWLRDPKFLDDYSLFWFRKGGALHSYTTWLAHAIWDRAAVTGDENLPVELLEDLIAYHHVWEEGGKASRGMGGRPNGLFYTIDDRDGGEVSIGGNGYRPLINSAMYGDRQAIAAIAERAGRADVAAEFKAKAAKLKELIQSRLWDADRQFFMILREDENSRSDVRELYGLSPWMFHLPDPGFEAGWRELMDPCGFAAPYGPTFPEQRHPGFALSYEGHECQWNGPSWPLATSMTLTALGNLLNDYRQTVVDCRAFFDTLLTYARSHRLVRDNGRVVPWIDENLNPYTGDWISRTRLKTWKGGTWSEEKGGRERGKDYNHSSFNDLIISGLVGLRPRRDNIVEVNPLLPKGTWNYFCLDKVRYHGHDLTIIWDKTGEQYARGQGLSVFSDGERIAGSTTISRVVGELKHSTPRCSGDALDCRRERGCSSRQVNQTTRTWSSAMTTLISRSLAMTVLLGAMSVVSTVSAVAGEATAADTNAAFSGNKPTIGLIGDSTVAEESGWGQAFASQVNDRAKVVNYAKNGATLESLSGRLDELLKLKPDYVLVQFGHNDQKRYDTDVYSNKLRSYIDRIIAAGGKPVILSSVVRRSFDKDGKIVSNLVKTEECTYHDTLTGYAKAAQAVAEKNNVAFVDLHAISMAYHNSIGREASMAYNFKEGDKTHFNRKGAEAIAELIRPALAKAVPELSAVLQ